MKRKRTNRLFAIIVLVCSITLPLYLASIHRPQQVLQHAAILSCGQPITFVDGKYLQANGTGFSYLGQKVCLYGATIYSSQGGTAPNYSWTSPQFTQRIDWDLALARQANLNIIRPVDQTNGATDDPYNPVVWQNMDYLVQQARAKGMFVLLDLSTFRNHLRSQNINPYDPAQLPAWQQYINFVVSRYKTAPNVSNYKIAGEINPPSSNTFPAATAQGYIDFFTATTTDIYNADGGNHLISAGGLSFLNNPSYGIPWQQIFSLPHVNIAAIHVYQSNRLDPINTSNDLHITVPLVAKWAQQNNKPYEIEEYGLVQQISDPVRATDMGVIQQAAIQNGYQGLIQWNLGPLVTGGLDYDVDPQTPLAWQQLITGATLFYGNSTSPSQLPSSTPNPTGTQQSPTPTVTLYPSGVSYCGASCLSNADCDTSGVTCGVCDSVTRVCVSGIIPTVQPSPSETLPVTGIDTPTVTPSSLSPTSPPTLSPASGTLSVHFDGIDPQNNSTPHHMQREVVLSFYSSSDFTQKPIANLPEIVTFSSADPNGSFISSHIDLSSLPSSSYYILIHSPEGSLTEILNNSQVLSLAPGKTVSLNGTSPVSLRMGDFNGDNTIDLSDYNILVDCYGDKETSHICKNHAVTDQFLLNFADINDDGVVDGVDYNILLRNFNNTGY